MLSMLRNIMCCVTLDDLQCLRANKEEPPLSVRREIGIGGCALGLSVTFLTLSYWLSRVLECITSFPAVFLLLVVQ